MSSAWSSRLVRGEGANVTVETVIWQTSAIEGLSQLCWVSHIAGLLGRLCGECSQRHHASRSERRRLEVGCRAATVGTLLCIIDLCMRRTEPAAT